MIQEFLLLLQPQLGVFYYMLRRRLKILLLLPALFALAACPRTAASKPGIKKGFIDFSGYSFSKSGPVELRGEWLLLWNQLPTARELPALLERLEAQLSSPENQDDPAANQPDSTFISVRLPGRWNGQKLNDESRIPGLGHGTFLLRYTGLKSDDMNRLAFRMKDALTAYRIYLYSEGQVTGPVMSNGVVGTSEDTSVPQHLPLVSPLPSRMSSGWIVLQVANYHDSIGGAIYPLILGTEKDLLSQRETKRARDFLVLGVLLLMSLYHLGLFSQRPEDRASLWFAVFNATIALRMLLTEKYIQGWFPEPDVSAFEWMMKFDYGTAFLAVPVFFAFLQSVFPWKISQILMKPAWILAGVFSLILIFPQRVYSSYAIYYFGWALVLALVMLAGISMAIKRKELGAGSSFAGLIALLAGGINDTLLADGLITSTYLLPYAFIFFVTAQSYILVRRFSHAFHTAEHLSEHLQLEVAKQTRELEEQNRRLSDVTRQRTLFFQNISHELRTPLTLIFGLLESISQGDYGPISEKFKRPVASMQKNARQLLRLINQLLDLSRIEAGQITLHLEAVNLSRMLSEMTESYHEMARRKGINLLTSIAPEVFTLGDPEKLEKVFYNLMSNAMKFTPAGGEVTVELQKHEQKLRVSILDTGPGIDEADRNRIFQRFFQGEGLRSRFQEGTGIGLAIVREFIDLHDGQLELESTPGEGSKFSVTLEALELEEPTSPDSQVSSLYRGDSESEYLDHQDLSEIEKHRPRILVVEDSEDMRNFIAHVLGHRYEILLAEDGAQGLELARKHSPDLLLSDVMMPVLDGPALISEIKSDPSLRSIPCALLSARLEIDSDDVEQADFYLAKPFQPSELRQAVEGFLYSTQNQKPGS
ncbi:MAG: hypothetical protein CMN77_10035 [Spirochaetaceae bacterium]|nr:hypothetical protein [Spirochaetaceae bacterium]